MEISKIAYIKNYTCKPLTFYEGPWIFGTGSEVRPGIPSAKNAAALLDTVCFSYLICQMFAKSGSLHS